MPVPAVLIAAHILSMLGFATYPALLPGLRDLWQLSNAEAGLIGSAFFAGYVATVSFWTSLTDRVDGRRVYAAGCLLAVLASLGFGLAAQGFVLALLFQALLGAGIAATYMPGLRLLSDRVSGPAQSRYIAFYTSFFGIGTAFSLLLAGYADAAWGWQAAFLLSAAGPLLAGAMVYAGVPPKAPQGGGYSVLFPLAAWRKVLAIRAAAGYVAGYTVHCIELFASRSWMVAFLAFSAGLHAAGESFPWSVAAMAAVVNVAAVPASIVGNEIALRIGRRRWILVAMVASAALGVVLALAAPLHWAVVLALMTAYQMLNMADSATLTAGLVAAAPADLRGAAMGLYSLAGFAGGVLGPALFGVALDLGGGAQNGLAWVCGYAAVGAGCLAAPLVVRAFRTAR